MLDLIQQLLPAAIHVEEQHQLGRVRHLLIRTGDGAARPCVLREGTRRELELHRTLLTPAATGAPALLGGLAADDGGQAAWLLLEGLPEQFPDFADAAEVTACYRHLAALHNRFTGNFPAAEGPWAFTEAEIRCTLSALPEAAALAPRAGLLTAGSLTLVHGDYHRWNLLLECPGRVRVLDWELAGANPPIWDLVMLAPDEPGWDGMPRGSLALLALRTYHEAGPLARLDWDAFLYTHTLARLFVAARRLAGHRARAGARPPGGVRAHIESCAEAEHARVNALAAYLQA